MTYVEAQPALRDSEMSAVDAQHLARDSVMRNVESRRRISYDLRCRMTLADVVHDVADDLGQRSLARCVDSGHPTTLQLFLIRLGNDAADENLHLAQAALA